MENQRQALELRQAGALGTLLCEKLDAAEAKASYLEESLKSHLALTRRLRKRLAVAHESLAEADTAIEAARSAACCPFCTRSPQQQREQQQREQQQREQEEHEQQEQQDEEAQRQRQAEKRRQKQLQFEEQEAAIRRLNDNLAKREDVMSRLEVELQSERLAREALERRAREQDSEQDRLEAAMSGYKDELKEREGITLMLARQCRINTTLRAEVLSPRSSTTATTATTAMTAA